MIFKYITLLFIALEKIEIYHAQINDLEMRHAIDSLVLLIITIIFPSLLSLPSPGHRGVLSAVQSYLKYDYFF